MKRTGLATLLTLLATAAWMLPSAADPPAGPGGEERSANAIRSIQVAEEADTVQVIIAGSTTPSFTTFKLQDPPRVFIDIAGADLGDVTSPVRVENGVIDQVVTMQLADERKAVGRIIVGLDKSSPYRIVSKGNDLIMTVAARPQARTGAVQPRQEELRRLEEEVRTRLAESEARVAERRQALERDLTQWEQRREEARRAAEDQQTRLGTLTEELNRATEKKRLVEVALQEAEREREALQRSGADEASRRAMAEDARARLEGLQRANTAAQQELETRRQAAEAALAAYGQQQSHLTALKSEVTATQSTLAALRSTGMQLQQTRQQEEDRLARLRQTLRQAEEQRARAVAEAAAAERRRAEAEQQAEQARRQREAAEKAGQKAAQARQTEQRQKAELAQAVLQAEQRRKAAEEATRREQQRVAEIAQARQQEEQRVAQIRAAAAEEQTKLTAYLEASRRAAAHSAEAQQRMEALRAAQQQEQQRAQAAAETRRQEETKARAAAETRQREEALLRATAEAARREAELARAEQLRVQQGTAQARQEEAAARAALAAAQTKVTGLQADLTQRQQELQQLSREVERLRAQEAQLGSAVAAGKQATAQELAQARQQAEQSSQRAAAAEAEVQQAARQIAVLQAQASEALQRAETSRAELDRARQLASRAERAEAEARSTRQDLDRLNQALREAQTASQQSQQELEAARRGTDVERQRAEQLGRQVTELRSQVAQLQSRPTAADGQGLQDEAARIRREAEAAARALADARQLLAQAETERAQARELGGTGGKAPAVDETAQRARQAALAAASVAASATSLPARATSTPISTTITDIRFDDSNDRSRVIIEHEGQADYLLQEAGDGSVVLHMDHARLPRALERTLDTSALASPVRSVSSFTGDQRTGDVRIAVAVEQAIESHVRREDGKLVWEFLKTGTPSEGGTVVGNVTPATTPGPIAATPGVPGFQPVNYSASRVGGYAATTAGFGRKVEAPKERFTGKRITIDLRDADIHNVLRLLAKEGRINIIASEEVSGNITLHLERIPWDQALDVILKTKGLTQTKEGEIIWITPLATLREQQKIEMEVKRARQELEPLEVRLITTNYADVAQLATQANSLLSKRGTVSADPRTKTIIIKDVPDHAEAVEDLLRRLDTQTPLVLIEGRIVEASSSYQKDIGIQWGGDVSMSPGGGNPTGLRFPSVIGIRGGSDDQQVAPTGLASTPNFVVNLPAAAGGGSGGSLALTFGSIGGAANLNIRLSALEEQGALKIISSPKVTTLDNSEAVISQGVSIPIAVVSAQGINTVFFDANLELKVTPHVTQDGHVRLDIYISKNTPDFSRTGARGDPTILRKFTKTTMMIRDGDTTVIGGIFTKESSRNEKKVPFFGDIPILGALFRFHAEGEERSELLIFITPRIVNRAEAVVRTGKAGGPATFR
ncbi:MAG: type IV pilus secretin PilQ [Myxococcota bacterium]|jgi:type IV pilus assembly protein PilQ|nr:type IV pilus secretin PilQ [Myxococcota bacterium]